MNLANLISVIVPMYNAEKYIEQCIDSIEEQTYENLEIILVDNNSSDNTLNIAKHKAERDSRIKILSCKKQGVSATRNVGLNFSHGHYISFVDSDDILAPNTYEDSISALIKYDPDFVLLGFYKFDESGDMKEENIYFPDGFFEGSNYKKAALDMAFSNKGHTVPSYVYLRVIKSSVVKNHQIKFDEKVGRSEDFQFLMKINMVSKSMYSMYNSKYYGYRQIQNSLSHSYTSNYKKMIDIIFDDLYQFGNIIGDQEYVNRLYYRNIIYYEICAREIEANKDLDSCQKNKMIQEIFNSTNFVEVTKKIKLSDGMNNIGFSFLFLKFRMNKTFQIYTHIKRMICLY